MYVLKVFGGVNWGIVPQVVQSPQNAEQQALQRNARRREKGLVEELSRSLDDDLSVPEQ